MLGRTNAQTIPNNDFETWSNDTFNTTSSFFMYDHPTGWDPFLSAFYWGFGSGNGPLSCYKSTSKYSGTYALNLTTENDSAGADMMTMFPCTKRPLLLNGYYKFTGAPASGDTSYIIVGITKGDPIGWAFGDTSLEVGKGTYGFTGATVPTYLPFSIPIAYKSLTMFPDSALILITSTSNFGSGVPGQKLWVDNLYFSGSSGVDEESLESKIVIYPNPVINYLNIDLRSKVDRNTDLEILDLSGRKVFSKSIRYFDKLDLSALESGVYILQIRHGEQVVSKKIVKN